MARKKSIAISRKPSAEPTPSTELVLGEPLDNSLQLSETTQSSPISADATPGFFGRMVYGTVYSMSYGVVFSALILGSFIPGSQLVGRALEEGADSAKRDFGLARRPRTTPLDLPPC